MKNASLAQVDPFCAFTPYRVVAIGGSAGAVSSLKRLLSLIPGDFTVPIVVVQHLSATFESRLPRILSYNSNLPCEWAEDGQEPRPGNVYVARPGRNLMLTDAGTFMSSTGPKPRMGWPNIDIFLQSSARIWGARGIAVILSGMLWDGAEGVAAVRAAGGATMVQHPNSAEHPDMPSAAVDLGRADLMLPLERIAEALCILAEAGVR